MSAPNNGDAGAITCKFDPNDPANQPPPIDPSASGDIDLPEPACFKCCDTTFPLAKAAEDKWGKCLEACPEDAPDSCFDACDTTFKSDCAAANGQCDGMDKCEGICDPEDEDSTGTDPVPPMP